MTVERRGNRKQYLYRSTRIGKRVVKQYVGSLTDPVATVVARIDRLAHATHAADRDVARQELDNCAALQSVIRVVSRMITRLVWRYLHGHDTLPQRNTSVTKEMAMTVQDDHVPETTITREQFDCLAARASAGSHAALDELRQVLRAQPNIYRALGDLDRHVQDCLVEQVAGQSEVAKECLRLRMAELRIQLEADGVSPLERLLVEHAITTWIAFAVLQIQAAQPHHRKTDAKYWDQRLDRAQGRYLAAVKALADVRAATARGVTRQTVP